jgi:hypothetical protein
MSPAVTRQTFPVRAWATRATAALCVTAILAGCEATSSPEAADPITVDALMTHVAYLADDSLYGRPAGWEDELTAAAYVRDRFAAAGLSPGVADYLQLFWIGEQPSPPVADPGTLEIFNGADDNASGTAVIIELARYLAQLYHGEGIEGSRRSIMFQAYGAEEIGLVGSNYYCANPVVPLTQVAAMVNFDMVGRLRDGFLTVGGTNSAAWWLSRLDAVNTDGLTLYTDNKLVGRTDYYCFYQAGRPAIHLFTGMHPQYHTPLDDPPLLNQEGLLQIAELAARLVRGLATAPTLPVD